MSVNAIVNGAGVVMPRKNIPNDSLKSSLASSVGFRSLGSSMFHTCVALVAPAACTHLFDMRFFHWFRADSCSTTRRLYYQFVQLLHTERRVSEHWSRTIRPQIPCISKISLKDDFTRTYWSFLSPRIIPMISNKKGIIPVSTWHIPKLEPKPAFRWLSHKS